VTALAWSTDGRLASGSQDRTIVVFPPLEPECTWVTGNFSESEWSHYIGFVLLYRPTCAGKPSPEINHALLSVGGRLFLAAVLAIVVALGLGVAFLRGDSIGRRIYRGGAIGAMVMWAGFLVSPVWMAEYRADWFSLLVFAITAAVWSAIGAAIARPGRLASRVFWGGWTGFALLGFAIGFGAEDAYMGAIFAVLLGGLGGLSAALVTRAFIRGDQWRVRRASAGSKG
jgi:hypothetical protein